MCGIAGTLAFGTRPEIDIVTGMLSRLPHRGPDGCGVYRDDDVALGHTRLVVIDADGGAQPMGSADETAWVVFNGEIYNYIELRADLEALGHRFRSRSDTEVIVHAWQEWGQECFARFNGQWALAIWDRPSRRLVLARDPLGICPLFHTRVGDRFVFASEVKALFSDPSVPRSLDRVGLAEVMTFWSTVAPRTVFAGVEQVPPGCVVTVGPGLQRTQPFWQPHFPPRGTEEPQDLRESAAAVREAVVDAIRIRFLRSDVPVGAYLSGGLDSAITAAVIRRYTDAPLQTFSVRFSDSDFDEGSFQRAMAERLGTEHHEITVGAEDIGEVFPAVVHHAETTILRAAPAPMMLLSGLARDRGCNVVVTGEGADEVFAGYDIFREARLREFIARDPDSEVRSQALGLLYPWMVRSPGQAPAFARGFFGRDLDVVDPAFSHRPRWDSTAALLGLTAPHDDWGVDVIAAIMERLPTEHHDWDSLSRAQWLEMSTLLPGYILSSQGDRMLMANSVEGRFPFLDPGVVQLASRIPARHKLLGLDEKHILKIAFADLVPPEILARPKQPYRAPDAASFLGPGAQDWMLAATDPETVAEAGVFEPRAVRALLAKCHRSGGTRMSNTDNMRLLAVLSTQLLHTSFIVGGGSSPDDHLPTAPMIIDRANS